MLVVNKLYPDEVLNTDLFKLKKEEQADRLEEIHRAFDPMEIKYCHMSLARRRRVRVLAGGLVLCGGRLPQFLGWP